MDRDEADVGVLKGFALCWSWSVVVLLLLL